VGELQLKTISPGGIPHALEKAEGYRLRNDPAQAESIYRDVLAVDAANHEALLGLILALTDQFGGDGAAGAPREAQRLVDRLPTEYERAYYTGIVHERTARASLQRRNVVRSSVYDGLQQAMRWYERAEALRPPGNDDALLRWNSCVRAIASERLAPAPRGRELPLE
jgi:thioredoxin-like negative regulator of GroEL